MSTSSLKTNLKPILAINDMVGVLARFAKEMARKRADARYPLNQPVQVGSGDADSFKLVCPAWGDELSNHGISLITERAFLAGKELVLRFEKGVSHPFSVRFRVLGCSCLVGNVYRVVTEFIYED